MDHDGEQAAGLRYETEGSAVAGDKLRCRHLSEGQVAVVLGAGETRRQEDRNRDQTHRQQLCCVAHAYLRADRPNAQILHQPMRCPSSTNRNAEAPPYRPSPYGWRRDRSPSASALLDDARCIAVVAPPGIRLGRERRNPRALNFYQRNRFQIREMELVFHCWIER